MRIQTSTLIGLIAVVTGCADKPFDPNAPAIDPNAPRVHILTPTRGTIAGDVQTVTVTGNATDDVGVVSVTVNDVAATLASDGSWTATVPVVPGTNLLHAVAKDASNNAGKESRAVVAGPMQALSSQVPNALTAALSAETFAAIAKGASGYLKTADLESLVAPLNPVVNSGAPNGPDCLYVTASVTSMSLGDTAFTLTPQAGGLYLDAELDSVNVGMHLDYAAACLSGSRDITIAASHVSVSGNLTVGVTSGDFDIHLDSPNVTLSGFDLELGGVPGDIVDLLDLNAVFGPILGWATEKFVVPMLNSSFANLNNTKTVAVMDTMVDISVKPSKITFSDQGAIVELDTSLRAHGDSGNFVFVPNVVPAMDLSQGFQLAVADDTANQLLTSLWSAKGLDKTIMLANGPYGDIGKLYDSVEISAAAPPFVDASGTDLVLTLGDLMVSFMNGEVVATTIAVNAEVDITVSADATGALRNNVRRADHVRRRARRLRRRDGRQPALEWRLRDDQLVRAVSRRGRRLGRARCDPAAVDRRRLGPEPRGHRAVRLPRRRRPGPIDKTTGTIAPGKIADLVVIEGDPLVRIDDVSHVVSAMKAGVKWSASSRAVRERRRQTRNY